MLNKKYIIGVIGIIIILGAIYFLSVWQKNTSGEVVACTMEALQCPDGSYVGRGGKSCEFMVCPGSSFIGVLFQNSLGFSMNLNAPKNGTNEVVYSMPIQIKVSNALGGLIGKKVEAFGSFSNGNTFVVDHLEEIGDSNIGQVSIGKPALISGVRIAINNISDSRCPVDVQCIQAGSLTLNLTLQSNTDKLTKDISSNAFPFAFDSYSISIVDIKPSKVSTKQVEPKDYQITFKVSPLK